MTAVAAADACVDVSVVIVNWNARDDLARCLLSLRPAQRRLRLLVSVVDNGSTDGSVPLITRRFPEVRVLPMRRNLGFAAANNVVLRSVAARYHLLLNPDCLVHEHAIERLVEHADANPAAGLLAPMLLNGDGSLQSSCRRFPSVGAMLFRNTPLGQLVRDNRWARAYLMADWDHREAREVDWLSGACLMVRDQTLAEIGLLDERFFMYCEDMDWCLRAHQSGWRVTYLPTARVTHLIGRSSDHCPLAMVREHHRSMSRYVRKHYGRAAAALAAPLVALRYALIWCRARAGR